MSGRILTGRVAHLVHPPAVGVEVGETNFDGFSSHRSARRIRVPHLTASLMRWATRPQYSPGWNSRTSQIRRQRQGRQRRNW